MCKSASTEWTNGTSGSANDGFGDPPVPNYSFPNGFMGAVSFTSPGSSLPPAHWTKCSVSGGVATLPKRTLTAEGDYTGTSYYPPYGSLTSAYVDNYQVTVHATPYYFRNTNFPGGPTGIQGGPGDLFWHYSWNSTDGNLAHLAGETVNENVTCTASTDIPPFGWQPPPLTDISVHAENGVCTDDNTYGAHEGDTPAQSFVKNYMASSFSLTQTFKFLDPATSSSEQDLPNNPGPLTITDSVYPDSSSPSGYSFMVTKDGTPSPPLQLP